MCFAGLNETKENKVRGVTKKKKAIKRDLSRPLVLPFLSPEFPTPLTPDDQEQGQQKGSQTESEIRQV